MSSPTVVVATRSAHKLREILQILPPLPGLRFATLDEAEIPYTPQEESVEAFSTFEENALAKARFFRARTPHVVMADDSGLCVDALAGAPGVHSKRFCGRNDLSGIDLDLANNREVVRALHSVSGPRTARYVCVIALIAPDGTEDLFHGAVSGLIVDRPQGNGGFGYDPHFFYPPMGKTFAQLSPEEKNRVSHRSRALRQAFPRLRRLAGDALDDPGSGGSPD